MAFRDKPQDGAGLSSAFQPPSNSWRARSPNEYTQNVAHYSALRNSYTPDQIPLPPSVHERTHERVRVGQNHTGALQPGSEGVGSNPDGTPWLWVNAGGRYGLSCDWREAVSTPGANGGPATIRAEECAAEEKQELVREILDRRRRAPPDGRVAACVRTKDFGRFLPEWLAFHYAVGVDEFVVNDDDSVDGTREVLEPFVRAGLVMYKSMKLES